MDERILAVAVGLFLLGNGTGFLANDLITDNRINDDSTIDILGCMYEEAPNFDQNASIDDGSCEYPPDVVVGCMDSEALNYNETVNVDNNTCRYPEPHVLMIMVDGWRPDSIAAADTPTIDMLMQNSAYSMKTRVDDTTISGSGHSSYLTGVWRDKHNIHNNNFSNSNYEEYPHWFHHLKSANLGKYTAAYHNWYPMADKVFESCAGCVNKLFYGNDTEISEELVNDLAVKQMDAVTLFLDDPDAAGHGYGFSTSVDEYVEAVNMTDERIGIVMDAIFARTNYAEEDWMVIISSDHAGTGTSHGQNIPEHREVPLIIWGAETSGPIWPNPAIVDFAPTALNHLGIEIEPEWELDGRIIGLESTGAPDAKLGVNLIFNGDAEYERGYAPSEQDVSIPGWTDDGSFTIWTYGTPTYLLIDSPGPEDRGDNYFGGGANGDASIYQEINLSAIQTDIGSGNLTYSLSAFLGGYSNQDDRMEIIIEFFDSEGTVLHTGIMGPVYAEDRDNVTGIFLYQQWDSVPSSSAYVKITMNAYLDSGYCDAYADNLSLTIS
ncbi:MAG: hypothetical protein CL398_07465 [Acidiferrobacteraceae bacterium]|nr:hypothetical protein [Acidiferrobacteraceae bacterium]